MGSSRHGCTVWYLNEDRFIWDIIKIKWRASSSPSWSSSALLARPSPRTSPLTNPPWPSSAPCSTNPTSLLSSHWSSSSPPWSEQPYCHTSPYPSIHTYIFTFSPFPPRIVPRSPTHSLFHPSWCRCCRKKGDKIGIRGQGAGDRLGRW